MASTGPAPTQPPKRRKKTIAPSLASSHTTPPPNQMPAPDPQAHPPTQPPPISRPSRPMRRAPRAAPAAAATAALLVLVLVLVLVLPAAASAAAFAPGPSLHLPLGRPRPRPRPRLGRKAPGDRAGPIVSPPEAGPPSGGEGGGGGGRRRKKKNKYAKFSKADRLEKDPLDAMVEESVARNREIEAERARGGAGAEVPLSEEELREVEAGGTRLRNKREFPDTRTIDPYDPATYGYTELGTVTGAHGVHGLLKVSAVTTFAERLCERGVRHLKAPNRRSPREVHLLEGRHRLGDEYLVRLRGIVGRDEANRYRGCVLYARQSERPRDMADGEYLIADLVGLDVFLALGCGGDGGDGRGGEEGGGFLGRIGGIVVAEEMCSVPGLGHDMLEVVLPRGRGGTPSWRDENVLLPFVPDIVPTVDLDEGKVYVSPPPGLLDLTYIKEDKVRIKAFLPAAGETSATRVE